MKIILTYNEGRSVTSRVSDDLADAMLASRKHCWNRSHIYELPPIAWRRTLDELRALAYGPAGGRAHRATSLYTAIAKLARTVREFELHPAFQGPRHGTAGHATEIVEAFRDGETLSPYPPGVFVALCPEHVVSHRSTVTVWRANGWCMSAEHAAEREGLHLRFRVGE